MKINRLHIHGDNILECENSLKLLSSSLNNSVFKLKSGPAYAPVYTLDYNGENFEIQLFPGYGRCNNTVPRVSLGLPLDKIEKYLKKPAQALKKGYGQQSHFPTKV